MEVLFTALQEAGFSAARVPDIDPFFVTDASFENVMETTRTLVAAATD
jgi:hypothetical protein